MIFSGLLRIWLKVVLINHATYNQFNSYKNVNYIPTIKFLIEKSVLFSPHFDIKARNICAK